MSSSLPPAADYRLIRNILIKAGLLFLACNLLFALLQPIPWLEQISAYNGLFLGRLRLPFGENPAQAYNFSLYQLDAMLSSHVISASKGQNEFRVLVVGDSSIWGYLLKPGDTLSGQLNAASLTTPDGRQVVFYNLGYPTISLTKDLLILQKSARYQPDLVIWLVTLEAFPREKQLSSPILQNNPAAVRQLMSKYQLNLDPDDPRLVDLTFWQQTIIGRRRALADLFRLQIYGALWAATGIDQYYPARYDPPQHDLAADQNFQQLQPPSLRAEDLSLDVLAAGAKMISPVPLLIVNEPIYISDGANSDIRYNFFYPRWAYDDYRRIMADLSREEGWHYLDTWDIIPAQEFTNSAIHYSPAGAAILAQAVEKVLAPLLDR